MVALFTFFFVLISCQLPFLFSSFDKNEHDNNNNKHILTSTTVRERRSFPSIHFKIKYISIIMRFGARCTMHNAHQQQQNLYGIKIKKEIHACTHTIPYHRILFRIQHIKQKNYWQNIAFAVVVTAKVRNIIICFMFIDRNKAANRAIQRTQNETE